MILHVQMHISALLLHLLLMLYLLLLLDCLMVGLGWIKTGCPQQGCAFPEQRCHLHP